MQQKKIIIFVASLFILSSAYLFWTSQKINDPNYKKDYWSLYFSDPKSNNSNFVIENHSAKNDFHWEVLADSEKIKEGDVKIEKGSNSRLYLEDVLRSNLSSIQENKKITIRV